MSPTALVLGGSDDVAMDGLYVLWTPARGVPPSFSERRHGGRVTVCPRALEKDPLMLWNVPAKERFQDRPV